MIGAGPITGICYIRLILTLRCQCIVLLFIDNISVSEKDEVVVSPSKSPSKSPVKMITEGSNEHFYKGE